jgi:L-2-hydroxyglutarate oxidase LhgO
MGIILTEFDNTLVKSKIEMPLMSSSAAEAGEEYHDMHMTDKAQTSVFGIHVPIIMINNTIVDFGDVICVKFGNRELTVKVLSTPKQVSKNEASLMFEVLDEKRIEKVEEIKNTDF